MTDEEIDKLLKQLDAMVASPTAVKAIICIRELRARRNELQKAMDMIATGGA